MDCFTIKRNRINANALFADIEKHNESHAAYRRFTHERQKREDAKQAGLAQEQALSLKLSTNFMLNARSNNQNERGADWENEKYNEYQRVADWRQRMYEGRTR